MWLKPKTLNMFTSLTNIECYNDGNVTIVETNISLNFIEKGFFFKQIFKILVSVIVVRLRKWLGMALWLISHAT